MTHTIIFWAICFICGLLGAALRGAFRDGRSRVLLFFISLTAALAGVIGAGLLTGAARTVFVYVMGCGAMLAAGVLLSAVFAALRAAGKKSAKRRAASKEEYKALRRSAGTRSLALLSVSLVLLSLGTALAAGVDASAPLAADVRSNAAQQTKAFNLLVCGVDYASGDEAHQQAMSDVILVANIDKAAGRATLLQIPRDTYVGTDLTSTGKINALFNSKSTDGRGGVFALAEVLHNQMQLPLDHYVCITMEGFRAAVDIIGGVEIELDKAMVFNLRDANEVVVRTVTLGPGTVTLDGETADLFVRYRDYANADLDRMDVQRYFLAALLKRLSATSAAELLELARKIYPYIDTDLSVSQLLSLALTVKGFSGDAITALRVPGEPLYHNGQSVFTLHKAELADMLNNYMRPYSADVSAEALSVVELQNTTSILDSDTGSMTDYGA
ncbi:MAG: LCP family protein [Oscillospiraceae bacterium]|nr:LCP family protein [Oscillospiraceae bacterium]